MRNTSPRERRKAAGLTQIAAAVGAGVSPPTVRLYEASPDAPREAERRKLDRFYAGLPEPSDSTPPPSQHCAA